MVLDTADRFHFFLLNSLNSQFDSSSSSTPICWSIPEPAGADHVAQGRIVMRGTDNCNQLRNILPKTPEIPAYSRMLEFSEETVLVLLYDRGLEMSTLLHALCFASNCFQRSKLCHCRAKTTSGPNADNDSDVSACDVFSEDGMLHRQVVDVGDITTLSRQCLLLRVLRC